MKKLITILILSAITYAASSQTYCIPSGGFGACSLGLNDFWITDVSLTGTGSTFAFSGGTCVANAPYYLNTGYQGDVVAGNTYTLSVTKQGNMYKTYFNVWVDWNNNDTLNNTTPFLENIAPNMLLAAGGGLTSTTIITIPAGVTPGVHRMRIRVQWNVTNSNNPCLTTGQAETKDFSLNVISTSIGIADNTNSPSSVIISPNPFTNQFQISDFKFQISDVTITNVLGQCVFQSANTNQQSIINVDLSKQPKGIYFVRLMDVNNSVVYTQRVIKK